MVKETLLASRSWPSRMFGTMRRVLEVLEEL